MVGIGNGFASYQLGSFIPIMSTFLMFWLYAAPAVRMSALMGLRFIGIATHDAIGIGEDGECRVLDRKSLLFFWQGGCGCGLER